jgi:signal transduction histidine kinase/GAF domain-containing protein/CheY-like chemotaxis protein
MSIPSFLDEAPLVLTTIASDGSYLGSKGKKGLEVFGLKPGERVGQNVFDAWAHRPDILAHIRKAIEGESFTTTIEIYGKSLFHIFFPIKGVSGKVTHIHVAVFDTSETHRDDDIPLERERRLRLQHEALVKLAKSNLLEQLDSSKTFEIVCELAARFLGVDTVGIWFFDNSRKTLIAENIYSKGSNTHTKGETIKVETNPEYFAAIDTERVIAVSDFNSDPLTAKFASTYGKLHNVNGLLDCPIIQGGDVVGIICHETSDINRTWSVDDKNFAASIADLLSLSLERRARRKSSDALRSKLEMERLLASLATVFINVTPKEIPQEITKTLGKVGEILRASYGFFRSADGQLFEWGLKPSDSAFTDITKPTIAKQGELNLISLPLVEGARSLGLIGFLGQDWDEEAFSTLQIVGEMFVSALARRELDKKQALHLTILDVVHDAVIVFDQEGTIIFSNKAANTLYPHLNGQNFKNVFSNCQKLDGDCEFTFKNAEGIPLTLYARFQKILTEAEATSQMLCVLTDITERKQLQEQTERNSKLETIGVLAGGIAHDFNNILTSISGAITLATLKPEELKTHFAVAEKAIARAKDLTQQFITFAKGGAPIKTPADLGEVARETVEFIGATLTSKIELNIESPLPQVSIDKSQLRQVIENLLINAEQAISNSIISVQVKKVKIPDYKPTLFKFLPPGGYVALELKDRGPGIPEANRNRIFDPYFTTKQGGTGLGLASCFSIMRHHQGEISFETGESGTTFIIVLPIVECAVESQTEKTTLSKRILVLDDEPMIRDTTSQMLSILGHEVVTCETAEEFITTFEQGKKNNQPFNLLIMDLTLPGGSRPEDTIRSIKKIDPDASVIVSSGYSNNPLMAQYKEHGFCAVMRKPYSFDELRSVVEKN